VPNTDGFYLFRVPQQILIHTGPRRLVAFDNQGRLVARERLFDFASTVEFFRGIQRTPGGAVLARKKELASRPSPVGRASIWAAPSYAVPARCTWLQVGRAVFGGGCRRYEPPQQGLSQVVPLSLAIKGRRLSLLWGQVGVDVSTLEVRFQDRSERGIPIAEGAFLYPVPDQRWKSGHRPAFVIARDDNGRVVGERLLVEYTLAR